MKNDYLIIRAVYASVITAIIILLAKIVAWYVTDSPTILATLADSFLDIAASLINFVAAKYALQPPDNEHRFGHGKAEDLAVFTQSTFFGLSGIFIIVISIKRLIYPIHTLRSDFGIMVMIFAMFATSLLLIYQTYTYKKTSSSIVKADRLHYGVDLLTNLAVIASLYLSEKFNSKIIDPIFAMFIALYLLYGAWSLISKAFDNLLDREFTEEKKKILHDIILSDKNVKGYHALKTRYAGRKSFIQFHLELDGSMSLNESHEIADKIESQIIDKFKDIEVIIHQDPERLNDQRQSYKA